MEEDDLRFLAAVRSRMVEQAARSPESEALGALLGLGKGLRPLLLKAAAGDGASGVRGLVSASAALELLHTASLVHDDIADGAAYRRGQPALHRRVGIGRAVAAGDWLLVRAIALLAEELTPGDLAARAVALVGGKAAECCHGQVADLSDAPIEDYVAVARAKTGAPFAAALALGVLVAGGSGRRLGLAEELGYRFGVAYQVRDDLADADRLGQPSSMRTLVARECAEAEALVPAVVTGPVARARMCALLRWLRRARAR